MKIKNIITFSVVLLLAVWFIAGCSFSIGKTKASESTGEETAPTTTIPETKPQEVEVLSVTISKTVDENSKATEPVVTFNDDETVHASVEAKNFTTEDVFEAKWFRDGQLFDAKSYSFETPGSGFIDFTITPSPKSEPGKYKVEIYLNGQLTIAQEFQVIGKVVGPEYSSEQLGFKINYPDGWDVQEDLDQNAVGFSKLSEPVIAIVIVRAKSESVPVKDLAHMLFNESKKDPNFGKAIGNITDESEITIGGEKAYEIHFEMISGKSVYGDKGILIATYHIDSFYYIQVLGQEGYQVPQFMDLISASIQSIEFLK
jgi:hypothetical protein